jgi:hypothetical protein
VEARTPFYLDKPIAAELRMGLPIAEVPVKLVLQE